MSASLQLSIAGVVLRHGVPVPLTNEAPSSWMSRLAMAQGRPLKEIMAVLQFSLRQGWDPDAELLGARLPQLLRQCCLHQSAFAYAARSMSLLICTGSKASSALLTWRDRSRFRCCPACLATSPIPYLDIRWRIADWRHCLRHSCLLEDRCWKCDAYITYPVDMEQSAAGQAGHASQRRCQRCSADLAGVGPAYVDFRRPGVVTQIELYRRHRCWP
ncbi:MAG: hypothetical protein E6Q67_05640 [Roseateles sp.]|nr:MAG: hypothetical protein E6Q67_05640 [Roseateles sp.]